jgi:hypothetical protein
MIAALTLGFRESLWAVVTVVVLAVIGLWAIWRALLRIRQGTRNLRSNERIAKGYCPRCGYDLAGRVDETCAECGYRFTQTERRRLVNIAQVLLRSRR